ncbi:hypothetical protein [Caballeronia sordidicola]|uniref:hypothetical protein n=1 Tax=Caballeronia sordidicola TaxID=196367 RepID=UPI0011805D5B|nr:hypothetical protein [Caballeronia sordidicola]
MIEIVMTGVVATAPKECLVGKRQTKIRVRVNVIDAKGKVQWIDCSSISPHMRERLARLRVGESVEIKGNPAWVFYLKADGVTQGLQAQVDVSVMRRLKAANSNQNSKETA